jgi:hypothetical protein
MHIAMVTKDLITAMLAIVRHASTALPTRVRQAALHAIANFSSFHDAAKDVISSFGVAPYLSLLEEEVNATTIVVPRILLAMAIYSMNAAFLSGYGNWVSIVLVYFILFYFCFCFCSIFFIFFMSCFCANWNRC